jgi:hypothetical protein
MVVILFLKSFRVKSGKFLVFLCKFDSFPKIDLNSDCHKIENQNPAWQIQLSSTGNKQPTSSNISCGA